MAQEVEKGFPDLVETDPKDFKRVNYSQLPLYLLQALKEQQKKIEELEAKLAEVSGPGTARRSGSCPKML